MTWREAITQSSPLARRLILWTVLFSSGVTLFLTAFQLYREYRHDLGQIEKNFAQIEAVHLATLTESLWATDQERLQLQLNGMLQLRDMHYLELREGDLVWAYAGRYVSQNVMRREIALRYRHDGREQTLGTLVAVATLDNVYARLLGEALTILVSNGIKTFLVAMFMLVLIYYLVTRHLRKISRFAHSDMIETGSALTLSRQPRDDELETTVQALNSMRARLRASLTKLAVSEAHYRDQVDASLDLICTHDLAGRLLSVNPRGAEFTGYRIDELIGRNLRELLAPKYRAEFDAYLDRVRRAGRDEGHMQILTRDGRRRVWSYRNTLRTEGVDRPIVRGTAHDVTEQFEIARALERSEARFRATFEQAAVGIAHVAPDGRWLRVNQKLCDIVGYPRAELLTKTFQDITHLDDLNADLGQVRRMLAGELQTYSMEKRYIRKEGRIVWINLTVSLVRAPDGAPDYFISVIEDVDARHRAEGRLRRSENLLAESQRIAHLGSFEWDAESGDLQWSDELYRIYGYAPRDFTPTFDAFMAHVHPDDREHVQALVARVLQEGEVLKYEERVVRPNGEVRVLATEVSPVKDGDGRVLRLIGACHDITERWQADQKLAGTSAQLHELLTNMADGFVRLDCDWRYTFVNKRAGEIFQRRPEELLGKNIWEEFPEGIGQPFYHAYHKAMADQKQCQIESYYPPWDKWFENRIYPGPEGLSIFFDDISARKRSERALADSEKKFRAIIDVSPVPFALNDKDQSITYLNAAFTRTYGYTLEDIPTLAEWWPKAYPDPGYRQWVATTWQDRLKQAQAKGGCFNPLELKIHCKDGSVKTVLVEAAAIGASWNDSHLVILYDITERKQNESRLEQIMDELNQRNTEMENFIYTISHDLKSPLVTVGGFSTLLEKDIAKGDTEATADSLAEIKKAVEQMQAHIRDLLLLSRTGRVSAEKSDVALVALLNDVTGQFGRRIETEGAQLDIAVDLPVIRVDRKGFVRVFTNLIDNALKYQRPGVAPRIEIGWQRQGDELRLYVRDNGQGIKQEFQQRIFGLFQRADSRTEGAGVGLAISKRVIEIHGGRMWVESEPDQGSTFWISLPASVMVNAA